MTSYNVLTNQTLDQDGSEVTVIEPTLPISILMMAYVVNNCVVDIHTDICKWCNGIATDEEVQR